MKALMIAIVLGGLGYYMFVYDGDSSDKTQSTYEKTEEQRLDEISVENTSYQGAITNTINKYKKGISDAKDAVTSVENRYK